MTEPDANAPFDVVLTDVDGQPMSEPHSTTWPDLIYGGITFTAVRAAVPRAVVVAGEDGRELFRQDRLGTAAEGETVSFGFFVNGRLLSA